MISFSCCKTARYCGDLRRDCGKPIVNLVMLEPYEIAAFNLPRSVAQPCLRHLIAVVIGMRLSMLAQVAVEFAHDFYIAMAAIKLFESELTCHSAGPDGAVNVLSTGFHKIL